MKVIFLDVDGVLNNYNTLFKDHQLEPDAIEYLAMIVRFTHAEIILTSTWRLIPEVREVLDKCLTVFNLNIAGAVSAKHQDRGAAIKEWLDNHEVEQFVILDDEDKDIKSYFTKELVKTNFYHGLTYEDAVAAIKLLN